MGKYILGIKDTSIKGDTNDVVYVMSQLNLSVLEYSLFHRYKEQEIWTIRRRRQLMSLLEGKEIKINSIFMSLMNKEEFNLFSTDNITYLKIKDIIIRMIDISAEIGTKRIILPVFYDKLSYSEGLQLFIERISEIGEYAHKTDVEMLFENQINSEINKRLIEKINLNNIKICFDTGNVYFFCNNICREFNVIKNYVGEIHLKDFPFDIDIGAGEIQFWNIIQEIFRFKHDIPLIIEKNFKQYENIEESKKVIKNIFMMLEKINPPNY